jgi:hypothetical protein
MKEERGEMKEERREGEEGSKRVDLMHTSATLCRSA